MAAVDALAPDVMIHAPEAPELLVLRFVIDEARRFCRATRIWREVIFVTVTAADAMAIAAFPDADIVEFDAVHFDGAPLEPVTPDELEARRPGWEHDSETGTPRFVTQLRPETITLYPRAAGEVTFRAVLEPSRKAATLPDMLVSQHGTTIARAAAAELLMLPGEWSDPARAGLLKRDAENDKIDARSRLARGQQRSRIRTKPRWM